MTDLNKYEADGYSSDICRDSIDMPIYCDDYIIDCQSFILISIPTYLEDFYGEQLTSEIQKGCEVLSVMYFSGYFD